MVDYAPELVSGLKTVLPTWADPVDKRTELPCITWMETDRRDLHAVNGMQYSTIAIRVRVWTESRRTMQDYADKAETALRKMGWSVTGCGELTANGRYCKILSCQAIGQDFKSW